MDVGLAFPAFPRVASVWLPQLPLRVEVLRHPVWDGRPMVQGGGPGERKVVQLCSPEAERAGIFPGLPLREVLPLSPGAVIVEPDPARVARVREEVQVRLQRVTPLMEAADDEVFLDLRGLGSFYHDDLLVLERAIRVAVPPLLRPRLGAGEGKFVASMAARTAGASRLRAISAAEKAAFLAALPARLLPLPPRALERLERLGLSTMGDLAALPFSAGQAHRGAPGAGGGRLARGIDDEPVVARSFETTVRAALRVEDPLASVDAILVGARSLVTRAFAQPLLGGRGGRGARLLALLVDGTSWERLVTFKEPVASGDAAFYALKVRLDLPGGLPPAPIEELVLELLGLTGEGARQPRLFLARASEGAPVVEALRQLSARYGQVPVYYAMEVEPWSRIPERRWALGPFET